LHSALRALWLGNPHRALCASSSALTNCIHNSVQRKDYMNTEEFLQKLADNLDAKVKTIFVRSNSKL